LPFLSTNPQVGDMAVIDRLRDWVHRLDTIPLRHLGDQEDVVVCQRQHPAVLIPKAIRTGSGVGMMVSHPTWGLVLIFAASILLETLRAPARFSRKTILVLVASLSVAVLLLGHGSPLVRILTAVAILIWLAADLLTWLYDRLVVTNRRLYRVHGFITTHRPSVALPTITVIDLELGPAGRWFGTLIFDTPAQRDGPLHRFTFVHDASLVHKAILRLRAEAAVQQQPPF
jgi:hypothetical protein